MTTFTNLVTKFLTDSFVEHYDTNKEFLTHLNDKLDNLGIPYNYTYDEFCQELLCRIVDTIENYDIPALQTNDSLRENFGLFISKTLKEMETCKIKERIQDLTPEYK